MIRMVFLILINHLYTDIYCSNLNPKQYCCWCCLFCYSDVAFADVAYSDVAFADINVADITIFDTADGAFAVADEDEDLFMLYMKLLL